MAKRKRNNASSTKSANAKSDLNGGENNEVDNVESTKSAKREPQKNGPEETEPEVQEDGADIKVTTKKRKDEDEEEGDSKDEEVESKPSPSKKRKSETSTTSTSPKLRARPKQLRPRSTKATPVSHQAAKNVSKKKTTKKKAAPKNKDFEVEKILESRAKKGKTEYLVRWKGYSSSEDTWEPESNLKCPTLLQEYKDKEVEAEE